MNLRPFLLNFSLLVGAFSLAVTASAQDQTINGNLFVNSALDVNGNTASFGTNGLNPGYSLVYTNNPLATVDFNASASTVNWTWYQSAKPQLKLDSTNTLNLYVPNATTPAITLNPAGTSTFAQGLTVTGTFTASGGLVSPNGIVTGGTTGLTLNAGGTNQNITLTPSGAGSTTTASPVKITNTTASTSTTTGALTVSGGVGATGTLTAGNVTTSGTVTAGTLKVTNVDTSLTNLGIGTANTANFGAINAADPSFFYPAPVAKVSHTATTGPFLSAPQVVTVVGNFAYVGSSSSTSFQIIDITNPLLPVKRGSLVGTGVAPAANLSFPRGIAISGNYAYVTSSTNNALQVINITNPDAPVVTAALLNGTGGALLSAPYGIAVSGSYAYIASSGGNGLEIVNIANPAAPVHAGKLTDATKLLGARAVAVSGSYAYVVSNTGNCLTVVNISSPAAPTLAASLAHNAAGPLLAGPTAIAISGKYAYVTSATSNALQIIDISNPLIPVAKGSLVSGTAGAQLTSPSALTVVGTTAFVTASGTTKALQVIDVSNPLAPTPKGQLLDGIGGAALNVPTGIAVAGNYAYVVASSSNALQVLSIASGGGFQIQNTTVLTKDANNNLLLGSGLPTGKVAIGTTNATSRLTVAGTDATAANSVANFTDSAAKSLLFVRNDGNIGIGTASPSAKLEVGGNLKVSGNLNVGLANTVTFSNSSAIGSSNTVTGENSIALGTFNTASGWGSTAIGTENNASGLYSVALGGGNTTSGYSSTALGIGTTASGEYSTTMGDSTTASGALSTAMGYVTTAQAFGSVVIGQYNVIQGNSTEWVATDDLFVIGNGTYGSVPVRSNAFVVKKNGDMVVSGALTVGGQSVVTTNQLTPYATTAQVTTQIAPLAKPTALFNTNGTAITSVGTDGKVNFTNGFTAGTGVTASGFGATAMGYGSTATGYLAIALGEYANARGYDSIAMGAATNANGDGSTAMGVGSYAVGEGSTAMGYATNAEGIYSTAMGQATNASGYASTAMGLNTTAQAFGSVALGQFNILQGYTSAWFATDDLFVIGNGTSPTVRSNAFVVKKNGDTAVSGTLTVGGQSVVTASTLTTGLAPYAKSADVTTQLALYQLSTGSGANLTALNATQITTGTLPIARIAAASVTNDKLTTNPLARANHTGTQDWATTISGKPTTVAGYGITDAMSTSGSGASLTALNATQITTGTLPIARIAAASVTNDKLTTNPLARANHTGTQAWSTLTATPTTVAGYGITDAVSNTQLAPYQLSAGSGASLTALNATQITTGTLPIARIAAASVTNDKLTTNPLARSNHTGTQDWATTISGKPTTVAGYGITDAMSTTGSGASLTALNATQITSGTLPAARIATGSLPLATLAADPLARANHTGTQAWSTITTATLPTTLAAHGITNAVEKTSTGDVTVTGATALQGSATVTGATTLTGAVTVKTVLRLPPSGDLGMGTFTTGTNPSL